MIWPICSPLGVDTSGKACEAVKGDFSWARIVKILVLLLVLATLAGCTDDPPAPAEALDPMPWSGKVQTLAFNPIVGATVTVDHPSAVLDDGTMEAWTVSETATDANGDFSLQLPPGAWNWTVTHPEFQNATGQVVPNGTLDLTMTPLNVIVPYQKAYPFEGSIECALEVLIITPSCDTLIQYAGEEAGISPPELMTDNSVFEIAFEEDWATAVLDIQFDIADHPGFAGMRVSTYAADASAELFNYELITQEWSPESFSVRLEPETDYGHEAIAPAGAGGMRFEFFPHGHGDDTICTPDGTCFLGVGASARFEFDVVATVFYHEAAPEGWTLLA